MMKPTGRRRESRHDGTVEEFLPNGVRFDSIHLGSRIVPWEQVAALYVEVFEEEEKKPEAGGVPVVLDLQEGSRLRGRLERVDRTGCRLKVGGQESIVVEWPRIVELLVDDGQLVYLSDLDVASETGKGAPFGDDLGMVWPHRVDRSVQGGPLRSGGRVWSRGLGTHAPTRLTWQLDGSWSGLRGRVAIDDSVLLNDDAARGAMVFRVLGDGRELWKSRTMRGGDPPVALEGISLAGVRELVFEADAAGDFRGDRGNWLGVLLTRKR